MKYQANKNIRVGDVMFADGKVYTEEAVKDLGLDLENDFSVVSDSVPAVGEDAPKAGTTPSVDAPAEDADYAKLDRKGMEAYARAYTDVNPDEFETKKDLLKAIEKARA